MQSREIEIAEVFDIMLGKCFEVAQQQKYGFIDSISAEKKIRNAGHKYKAEAISIIRKIEHEFKNKEKQ